MVDANLKKVHKAFFGPRFFLFYIYLCTILKKFAIVAIFNIFYIYFCTYKINILKNIAIITIIIKIITSTI